MRPVSDRFLEFSRLSKHFPVPGGGEAVIVEDFDLRVAEGEFVCVIGHSGCGKSTVLSIAMGLASPSSGGIILAGREIVGPGLDRGVVFQSPALLPWLTARENVLLALDQALPDAPRGERRRLADAALARVGLAEAGDRRPAELSAGMQQRVGIARAFAVEPRVLLLDEPFSLLDAFTRMDLQDEMLRLWEEDRRTVVMVTHDVDEALLLADRVVMMTSGPRARVGEILRVPFARPRQRARVLEDARYYPLRERLLAFLAEQGGHQGAIP
ncbi:MAG: ABC transporter ATP-binding protein [Deltaproteobacteria bacterium]|nr:ABC transporter ATP-binding protein [Deltaproteobacteria bacterium]